MPCAAGITCPAVRKRETFPSTLKFCYWIEWIVSLTLEAKAFYGEFPQAKQEVSIAIKKGKAKDFLHLLLFLF